MRELFVTGTMHNRIRMLAASYYGQTAQIWAANADPEAKRAYLDAAGPRVSDVDALMRASGKGEGLREAARLIAATLGAPTPLDRAVAEVVAVPDDGGPLADAFDRIGEVLDLVGDESTPEGTRRALAKVARVALAGMLACDASPSATKEPG